MILVWMKIFVSETYITLIILEMESNIILNLTYFICIDYSGIEFVTVEGDTDYEDEDED